MSSKRASALPAASSDTNYNLMGDNFNATSTGNTKAPRPDHNGAYTGWGIGANWEALVAYLFGWITGLVVVLTEQDNFYCVFHGFQSIVWSVFMTIILIIAIIIDAIAINNDWYGFPLIVIIVLIIHVLVSIICMIFAYKNGESGDCWKLPGFGQIAHSLTNSYFPTNCCTCCCV